MAALERRAYGCVSLVVGMAALAFVGYLALDVSLSLLGVSPTPGQIGLIVLAVALGVIVFGDTPRRRRVRQSPATPSPMLGDVSLGRSLAAELEDLRDCWDHRLITEAKYRAARARILGSPEPPSKR